MLGRACLTAHEIPELLKVREPMVRGWVDAADLGAVRLGGESRVAARDLEAFLNARADRAAT